MKMMNKLFATLLIAALCLGCVAMAEVKTFTDRDRDLTFEYDDEQFEITMEDYTDDETMIILSGKVEAWGPLGIKFYMADLDEDEGDTVPTLKDYEGITEAGGTVTQGEWNGFKDVITLTFSDEESLEQTFVVPLKDQDDNEVEDVLSITVNVQNVADEETAMARDDAISAVLDSMKLIND